MIQRTKDKQLDKHLSGEKPTLDYNNVVLEMDTLFNNLEENKNKPKKFELSNKIKKAKKAPSQKKRALKSNAKKKKPRKTKKNSKTHFPINSLQFQRPKRMTLVKIIRILFIFFLTITLLSLFFATAAGGISIEILYVSIFIGIVVLKELTDEFTPNHLKKKINIFISGLLVGFLLIVINEIIILISS